MDGEDFPRSFCCRHPEGSTAIVPSDLGWQHWLSDYKNTAANMVTKDSASLLHGHPKPLALFGQWNEPHGQFSYASHFGAPDTLILSPFTRAEKLNSVDHAKDDAIVSKAGRLAPNQIEVIGRSSDWTNWAMRQWVSYHSPAEVVHRNSREEAPLTAAAVGINDPMYESFGCNQGSDLCSEMHEDTEELDALLYSDDDDDDDCSEEGEVDSTGHSPCTLTICEKEQFDESMDEILSSAEPSRNRKRKLHDNGDSAATSVTDTASSPGINRHQNEAVSRYPVGEVCSVDFRPDSKKRMRRDEICEAVSVLENIVPDSKGKSAVTFLDEAIRYLESLKAEALSLGFS